MQFEIPKMMKAVSIRKDDGSLFVHEIPVPRPGPGEVLVKIAVAPINPSDNARIKNMLSNSEVHSFVPGIEGSGLVVAHGKGLIPFLWNGKRVSCTSTYNTSGTWAEYMVTSATKCSPIPKELSYEQGSMLIVNPMTAVAFFDIIKKQKHKTIINTAAAGALGKMINLLGNKHSVVVINIVRSERQKEALIAEGIKYVLNSIDVNFSGQLSDLVNTLKPSLALDAIGGTTTQLLLDALPYGGMLMIYGNLSETEHGINLKSLIPDNKQIAGFYLGNWAKDNGLLNTLRSISRVKKLLTNEIEIKVQNKFPLEKVQEAVNKYLSNMTDGKVLLIANPHH